MSRILVVDSKVLWFEDGEDFYKAMAKGISPESEHITLEEEFAGVDPNILKAAARERMYAEIARVVRADALLANDVPLEVVADALGQIQDDLASLSTSPAKSLDGFRWRVKSKSIGS